MRKFNETSYAGILALSFAVLMLSCDYETGSYRESAGSPGVVGLQINLGRTGALYKTATGDTNFNLDSLKVILTATGQTTQSYAYAIRGNAATSSVAVTTKYYTVASLITWKAKILSIDTTSNPSHTDTVHIDSVTFRVNPADTTFVSPTLNSSYSIVKARFFSNNSSSIPSPIRYVRLKVGGVTRDSASIGFNFYGARILSSSSSMYVVGSSGSIFTTSNSGSTWTPQTSGTTLNLNSVDFIDDNNGWAVGDSGRFLTTTNGGTTWTSQTSGTTANLHSVRIYSTSVAWVVGDSGKILKTTNGTSWSLKTSGTTVNLYDAFFTDKNNGLAVGASGKILYTTNGGTDWSSQTSNTTQDLHGVDLVSATSTVVGNAGTILRTTNSGTTWTAQTSGTTVNLRSVDVNDGDVTQVYTAGEKGVILYTTNGGTTWTSQTSGTTQNLNWVDFRSSVEIAVGDSRKIVYSSDGTTWTTQNTDAAGVKLFDILLAYKYLRPNVSNTIVLQAIDTLSGTLRGYEATRTINLAPGKDSTLSTTSLDKCGYSGYPACTL